MIATRPKKLELLMSSFKIAVANSIIALCAAFLLMINIGKTLANDSSTNSYGTNSMQVSQGTLIELENFPSQFIKHRTVRVWLPNDYDESKEYPIIFMHDGQMLFDANTTWNNQEWGVDEVAQRMIDSNAVKPFIVVGVDSVSAIRHAEYFPQAPFETLSKEQQTLAYSLERSPGQPLFGGEKVKSDSYLKFLVSELKPYLFENFAVSEKPEQHFIMGSSMGGLISWYAISEYPTEFGGAASMSTHWLGTFDESANAVFESFYTYLETQLPESQQFKLYFDYGDQTLDQYYPPYQKRINKLLAAKGYREPMTKIEFFPGSDHSEASWTNRLHIPFQFLIGNDCEAEN